MGPSALTNTCGDVNEDIKEYRYDLEVKDTAVLNDTTRAVVGAAIRYDSSDSETLYDQKVVIHSVLAFTTLEWKPSTQIVVNVGGSVDYDDLLLDGTVVSPPFGGKLSRHTEPNGTFWFF